ncbi:MAG: bifunctional glutamate N-acetyltransferase/amino-acid acetyltransferase ArgJ [Candidatus Omnitrophota bacterium]
MKKHKLPKGFLAGGIHCGAKKKRKDLSLFYSEKPCRVAACFTTNAVKAAPLVLTCEQLKKTGGWARAVVVNSGHANCMTGSRGLNDARKMAKTMAELINVPKDMVLVSSTGVIGVPIPMKPVIKGMKRLVSALSTDGLIDAADGIMTTDFFRKITSRTFVLDGKKIRMTAVGKGAGMIEPNMATMLCYILTDAAVSAGVMKKALSGSVGVSFNALTVDGDMSTNDTVMLLANGAAGNKTVKWHGKDLEVFRENLDSICIDIARMVARDGEGAEKFMEVCVRGARSRKDAGKIAKSVAGSLLVKCAVLGGDPNWGRIASSAGASGVVFDPEKMEIKLDGVTFLRKGSFAAPDKKRITPVFKGKDVLIEIDLHGGKAAAVVFSCEISKKYIRMNAHYTT